jgi:CheY-like chemotaxis protein
MTAPAPRPIEILLVDDSDDDALLLAESFREAHMMNIVHVVHDGEEALDYLFRRGKYQNAATPGLVLLDLNMPRKNGFEVLGAIKADSALRGIPVVMLTTSSNEEDVARSYAKGACSFVSKPVSFEKLREVIRQFALYWTLVAVVPPPVEAPAAPA